MTTAAVAAFLHSSLWFPGNFPTELILKFSYHDLISEPDPRFLFHGEVGTWEGGGGGDEATGL